MSRTELIAQLLETLDGPAVLTTREATSIKDAADMLEADGKDRRKPLSASEVEQILARWNYDIHGDRARYIVRETELAHRIKEQP